MSTVPVYPVRVEGRLDPGLSRWLWLVKWLLVIPHVIVLAFLWIAFVVLSAVAFFGILFTGRYPRSIFDFNVGVLRWTWRVAFYSYSALGTDRYPPFTLGEVPDYPTTVAVAYPDHLSRGLVLVKWWLLAIPHYLVLGIIGGAGWFAWQSDDWRWSGGFGLVGLLVLIAGVALLFGGRYPRGIFDLVLGLNRWVLRVAAYAGLMTDQYPPFRLDLGGAEPGAMAVGVDDAPPPAPASQEQRSPAAATPGWQWPNVVLVVLGSIAAVFAPGLVAAGIAVVAVDQTQRDAAGFVMTPDEAFSTGSFAIVSESVDVRIDGPDWAAKRFFGDIRVRSESDRPVFVGIAREADVATYLDGVSRAVVTRIGPGDDVRYADEAGGAPAGVPAQQEFWAASTTGSGTQVVDWELESGNWNVVVMNADGSRAVDAELSVGAELDSLVWLGIALLVVGGVFLLGAGAFLYAGVPKGRAR